MPIESLSDVGRDRVSVSYAGPGVHCAVKFKGLARREDLQDMLTDARQVGEEANLDLEQMPAKSASGGAARISGFPSDQRLGAGQGCLEVAYQVVRANLGADATAFNQFARLGTDTR